MKNNESYSIGLYGRDDFQRYGILKFWCIPERSAGKLEELEKEILILLEEKKKQEKAQQEAINLFKLGEGINYTRFFLATKSKEVADAYKKYGVELIS